MATLTLTPPYDAKFTDRSVGAGGRVLSLKAEISTGNLEVSIGTTADPGNPLKTQTAALAAVGVLVDTPPHQTLEVVANLHTSLDLTISTEHAEADASGYSGLIVFELDQNLRPVAVPLARWVELWHVNGSGVSLNFRRPDRLAGSCPITPGRLYQVWAWSAGDISMKEDPGGSPRPNTEIARFSLTTQVHSFVLTAS
jgi:hypothetical protein